jgi:hypothetical protein
VGGACDEVRNLGVVPNPSEWTIDRKFPARERAAAGQLGVAIYLFLLCAEGFSAMLAKAEMEGELRGIKNFSLTFHR